jgi:hypothetical protein
MNRIMMIVFALIVAGGRAVGGELSGSFSSGIDSQYLVEPGFVAHNRPIWWNRFRLEKDGWYGTLWGSLGIDDEVDDNGEELDIKGGKKFGVAGYPVDLSGGYFFLAPFASSANDAWAFDGRMDFPGLLPWITPWLAVQYLGEVGEKSAKAGWFGWVGAQRTQPFGFRLPLQEKEFSLDFDADTAFSGLRELSCWFFVRQTDETA